jgi:hypothetical protein
VTADNDPGAALPALAGWLAGHAAGAAGIAAMTAIRNLPPPRQRPGGTRPARGVVTRTGTGTPWMAIILFAVVTAMLMLALR